MAEIGGATLAEMQPKPAGVVEKVKGKLREFFTPTGRAEVMAQKQIDTIIAQVAPQDRVKAMEHLEKMRPDFVAGKMEDAKGSLVRDAVIGAAAVGTVAVGGGVAYAKRENINAKANEIGFNMMASMSETNRKRVQGALERTNDIKENVGSIVKRMRDKITGLWRKPLDMNVPDIASSPSAATKI